MIVEIIVGWFNVIGFKNFGIDNVLVDKLLWLVIYYLDLLIIGSVVGVSFDEYVVVV